MAQDEIIKFLDKQKGIKFDSNQIAGALGQAVTSITINLLKIRKWNFAKYDSISVPGSIPKYIYWR